MASVLALIVALAMSVATAAPAVAQSPGTTYLVSVYATEAYTSPLSGAPIDFQTRVSPSLPAGVTLTGSVSCTEIYVSGDTGATEAIPTGALTPGAYYFVTSSCTGTNLALSGMSQPYALQLLGDTFTVEPDVTYLVPGTSTESASANPPTVTLQVGLVYFPPVDASPLTGQTVTFGVEGTDPTAGGLVLWQGDICTATTTASGLVGLASCILTGQEATNFIDGTGAWTASFAGSSDYQGSQTFGELGGDTTPGQATQAIQALAQRQTSQVTVVPDTNPNPSCHPSVDQTGVGLITVSLGQLNCSEIQVLQIVDGVSLGAVAFVFSGGGSTITEIAGNLVFYSATGFFSTAARSAAEELPNLLEQIASNLRASTAVYVSGSI